MVKDFIEIQADIVALAVDAHMQGHCKFKDWQYFDIDGESVYCLDLIDSELCEPSPNDTSIQEYKSWLRFMELKAGDYNWELFHNQVILNYARSVVDEYKGQKILARLF